MALLPQKSKIVRSKRILLVLLILLIVITAVLLVLTVVSRPRPSKNILLIVLDTVRADRLGCYGNTEGITPQIDKFAQNSFVLENAFSHSPWTLPSIASLLTSNYPAQHGAGGFLGEFKVLPPSALTLAELCRKAGLATAAVVNVFFLTEKFGMTQGFDTVNAFVSHSNRDTRRAGPTTQAALNWIDKNKSKPFFLFVHYFDPHLVYDPPQPFRGQFAAPRDKDTTDFIFGTVEDIMDLRQNQTAPTPGKIQRLKKLYNGEIAYTDSQVGKLIQGISKQGLDKNTIIIITADHGEEFLEHNGFEHGHTLYDELLHVPLIIRTPDIMTPKQSSDTAQRPSRISATVRLIDVAPTVCELADIKISSGFSGKSIRPLLEGIKEAGRPVLSQGNMWGPSGVAWRKDGMKIIIQSSKPEVQLFDVSLDPAEKENLADLKPEVTKTLRGDLHLILKKLSLKQKNQISPQLTPEEIERLRSLGYIR